MVNDPINRNRRILYAHLTLIRCRMSRMVSFHLVSSGLAPLLSIFDLIGKTYIISLRFYYLTTTTTRIEVKILIGKIEWRQVAKCDQAYNNDCIDITLCVYVCG